MTPPSKLFALGLLASLICLGAGRIVVMQTSSHLRSLVGACHAESEKAQHSNSTIPWEKDPLVCDPQELAVVSAPVGIQAQIASTYKRLSTYTAWAWLIPSFIVAVSAVPFLCDFLLRRIRELRGAIVRRR